MSKTALFNLLESVFSKARSVHIQSDPPFKSEVYNMERLTDYAKYLAHLDKVSEKQGSLANHLRARLDENKTILEATHKSFLLELSEGKATLPPSAEWLIDNFYLIQDQIRQVRHDMSGKIYARLPILTEGSYSGLPRVYRLAIELLTHSDSKFDEDILQVFISEYQKVSPLNSAEIWALPIMLRLALLENLRRLMDQAVIILKKQQGANIAAEKLLNTSKNNPKHLLSTASKLLSVDNKPDPVFVVHFLHRLRDAAPEVIATIRKVEERIAEQEIHLEEFIKAETRHRATNRVSVGNVISTLRLLSYLDWAVFFENVSLVEKILQNDPSGVYTTMDFHTRDSYRHVIEQLNYYSVYTEQEIARQTIKLCIENRPILAKEDKRLTHVGYYLHGKGIKELKDAINYSPTVLRRTGDFLIEKPLVTYFSTMSAVFFGLFGLTLVVSGVGLSQPGSWWAALLLLVPISAVSVSAVNWFLTSFIPPSPPPKIELKDGIPKKYRTMVVVPCLVSSRADAVSLTEKLEKRYLANRDKHLHFALLSDYADAQNQHMSEDTEILNELSHQINTLNKKYSLSDTSIFYLFHRHRLYNQGEGVWMGWERKRGKLVEFNKLLRGARDTTYSFQVGDLAILPHIKYVITLDADTDLPINTAKSLIGAMMHPLNTPIIDKKRNIVVEGYGIIQPRVDVKAPAAVRSLFAHIYNRESGLDLYSSAVSNVHQDLFGYSIFAGKAIYDVDAVEQTMRGRFPENSLLSHDLLEGSYARAGLATNIELLEDYPSGYDGYSQRQHRWIRGDWQILEWLLPYVPLGKGAYEKNPLLIIDRWKIFDNLRRSLVHPSVFLLLIAGWFILPGDPLFWTIISGLTLVIPVTRDLISSLKFHPQGESFSGYLAVIWQDTLHTITQALLLAVFLIDQAYLNTHAVLQVAYRKLFTKKNLLQWTAQDYAERGSAKSVSDYINIMRGAIILTFVVIAFFIYTQALSIVMAVPFLALWLAAPILAYKISQPLKSTILNLTPIERDELRLIALKIWRFFEEFATENDNNLPPDNFQLVPSSTIAHRTSPTNIGLYLMAIVSAYDFGYISKHAFEQRVNATFDTLKKLKKHKGHFYNWYNTQTLEPLMHYISTVDSGNLAAALILVKQTCLQLAKAPQDNRSLILGLQDILQNIKVIVHEGSFESLCETCDVAIDIINENSKVFDAQKMLDLIDYLENSYNTLAETTHISSVGNDLQFWVMRAKNQLADMLNQPHTTEQDVNLTNDGLRSKDRSLLFFAGSRTKARDFSVQNKLENVAIQAQHFVNDMDFSFLLNDKRNIFSIGFNLLENKLDNSFYDLLASEARIAGFVAISQGQVKHKHWFNLSRPLTRLKNNVALLSWGGTMFEYLMPSLFMYDYENTLIAQTNDLIVQRQIDYAKKRRVPWGISESAFYAFDYQYNYQYRLFGVPELGLRAEHSDNLVISPYSTFLALSLRPHEAWKNLQKLKDLGVMGSYGFYESVDFTPSRVPKGKNAGIVQSYYAHHQGMSLAAINNYLNNKIIQNRFHADPAVASAELLLQEKIPRHVPAIESEQNERLTSRAIKPAQPQHIRMLSSPHTVYPRTQVLSNGDYSVVTSNSGASKSSYKNIEITGYSLDQTLDNCGTFVYLKDVNNSYIWSATYQPTLKEPEKYFVNYLPSKTEYIRQDFGIETKTEVTVSPETDVELRRITLTNLSQKPRTIELTSYGEVALDEHLAVKTHPAFSKLFVNSEFDEETKALIFKRTPSGQNTQQTFAIHKMVVDSDCVISGYETDRLKFIGRNASLNRPNALFSALSNSVGVVLDPIFSLRTVVTIMPGALRSVSFVTGVSDMREKVLALAKTYAHDIDVERTFDLAKVHSQIELQHLEISREDAYMFQRLGSRILYPDASLKSSQDVVLQNKQGQRGLFNYGISGDNPIVMVTIKSAGGLRLVRQLILAHEYLRMKNFLFDLVILEDQSLSYSDELYQQIQYLIETSLSRPWMDKKGGVFLRKGNVMSWDDKVLFYSVARVVLDSDFGDLLDHLNLSARSETRKHVLIDYSKSYGFSVESGITESAETPHVKHALKLADNLDLEFFNGFGGFSVDGGEYVVKLNETVTTPLPWCNVIANEKFGTLVSESSLGYTWAINSQQNKITPWSNDSVLDNIGEILYLRDERGGDIWTPTPMPIRDREEYVTRHGMGYTIFEHTSRGVAQEVTVFVDSEKPVKFIKLKLKNIGTTSKNLSATFFTEFVLGTDREQAQQYITTKFDNSSGALFAKNIYNAEFNGTAFVSVNTNISWISGDRKEFIGRNGTKAFPQRLVAGKSLRSTGRLGAHLDPCGVIQTKIELEAGEEKEVVFILGYGNDETEARNLVKHFKRPANINIADKKSDALWSNMLRSVQVNTPSKETNFLLNNWLLYQVIACRIWARAAFYQAGGAYGYRDQLQDVMALVYSMPHLARQHIIRSATHQFAEGDVLHWWHEPVLKGVRTRISDDYLWLPYVTAYYVGATGDNLVLDELVPFVEMPLLEPDQHKVYGDPTISTEQASVYEHCVRALNKGLKYGEHGLPLMGTGDWNDGMNSVGDEGKGESIWLGWFLYSTLQAFIPLCEAKGDTESVEKFTKHAADLKIALNQHGWDGDWFRRAYFDNGTPLGSAKNEEGAFDCIAQAWAVISQAGDVDKAAKALQMLETHLVKPDEKMILLLDPAFSKSEPNAGYIQSYPAGIRENGGQYTHGVVWAVLAQAMLGNGDKAFEWFNMLNPINHGNNAEVIEKFKVEPYVMTADVYNNPQHVGRGGWSWYTGSASWMYRIGVEWILGLKLRGDYFVVEPCIPVDWPGFSMVYRCKGTVYEVEVKRLAEHGGAAADVGAVGEAVVGGQKGTYVNGELVVDGRVALQEGVGVVKVVIVI